jgi:hypothetical protein
VGGLQVGVRKGPPAPPPSVRSTRAEVVGSSELSMELGEGLVWDDRSDLTRPTAHPERSDLARPSASR